MGDRYDDDRVTDDLNRMLVSRRKWLAELREDAEKGLRCPLCAGSNVLADVTVFRSVAVLHYCKDCTTYFGYDTGGPA